MKKLPLFPLPVVLFPGTVLPLQIFELRYRRMVKECLADNSPFVVLQTRDVSSPDSDFYPLGTCAIISDWQPLANQMIGIQVQGQQRVRVTDIDQATDGLLQGYIEILADNPPVSPEEQSVKLEVICAHLQQHSLLSFDPSRINVDTAELFSFQLASLLPFSGADKQRLLEITSLERLELMATLLKEF